MSALALALAAQLMGAPGGSAEPLSFDRGASGVWRQLQKLRTTASLLHTTAHPDDEQGGMLALLGRGRGVRVALVSLTRGEAGANAIGPELFDSLGTVRSEELTLAARYYGLDALYFTRLADYGYSKRLEEAVEKWGIEEAIRDLVHLIRMEQPLVIVSRFQGNERDGHGQHQFAGMVTREAYRAAADPDHFPEQIASGLRPWQPLALYIGGVREDEPWDVCLDAGVHDSWLGRSYESVAREGLSLQRSQTSGRVRRAEGSFERCYERVESVVAFSSDSDDFFSGIDTTLVGAAARLRPELPADLRTGLERVEASVERAVARFSPTSLTDVIAPLKEGLELVRSLTLDLDLALNEHEPLFSILEQKEQQFVTAILLALGVQSRAEVDTTSMTVERIVPPLVPGDRFDVRLTVLNPSAMPLSLADVEWEHADGFVVRGEVSREPVADNAPSRSTFSVELSDDVPTLRPHIVRSSIEENRYEFEESGGWYRAAPAPPLVALVRLELDGVELVERVKVTGQVPVLPYGHVDRELVVLPELSVSAHPNVAVLTPAGGQVAVTVAVRSLRSSPVEAEVFLETETGLSVEPPSFRVRLGRYGDTGEVEFQLGLDENLSRPRSPPNASNASHAKPFDVSAVARFGVKTYRSEFRPIVHRDLEARYQVLPARVRLLPMDISLPFGLLVGYVMGVGDEVPEGIERLGARVEFLDGEELQSSPLSRFDAIVLGTRAYAVRTDLRENNRRLLDYVRGGGNLITLYNTQEFEPAVFAPYPGELTARAEEVSEEDADVRFLAPDHRVLTWPNRITPEDFRGWVELRGSKFWSAWAEEYTPIVSSNDLSQEPQDGGWLWCRYGEGSYTYFAYALHRQLPFGVSGAYRILANLLSLGREGSARRR